jgi:mersacidin/lichenicidin family type 2 lantibiotic
VAYRDIIRAWKGEEYRLNLSHTEQVLLPYRQDGLIELTDAELGDVGGGFGSPDPFPHCPDEITSIPRTPIPPCVSPLPGPDSA